MRRFTSLLLVPVLFLYGIGTLAVPPDRFGVGGFLLINPPRGQAPISVNIPGVEVTLSDKLSNVVVEKGVTDLSGRFRFSPQKPSRYQVCWSAAGIQAGCTKTFSNAGKHVYLGRQALQPLLEGRTTLFGTVRLSDGSKARRLEPLLGVNAYPVVVIRNILGKKLATARVNNFGDYVVPGVVLPSKYRITASVEGATSDRLLARSGLLSERIDLVFEKQYPPKISGLLGQSASGKHWTAAPGEEVTVRVDARDPDGDPLTYRWILPDGSTLSTPSPDPKITYALPNTEGRYQFTALVADGRGGYARESIEIATAGVRFGGTVTATDAPVVANAEIEVNGKVATTDGRGHFALYVPEAERYILNIHKRGYGLVSKIYDNSVVGGTWLLTRASVASVDPSKPIDVASEPRPGDCPGALSDRQPQGDKTATGSKRECGPGIRVRIPANGLVDANGNAPTGPVEIELTTVDLRAPDGMPGDFSAEDSGGNPQVMESWGAGTVEIFGDGRKYNVRPGMAAEVTIPIPQQQLQFPAGIKPEIPVISYDESKGVWQEEGTLARVGDAYVGKVPHFSAVNADQLKTNQACIRLETTLLPPQFNLEATIPSTSGGAPIVKTATIDNTARRVHVIYNLPTNVNVSFRTFNMDASAIQLIDPLNIGTPTTQRIVASGGPQNPLTPNQPEFPYAACQSSVDLTPFRPAGATIDEFLSGLGFGSVNLTDLEASNASLADQFKAAGAAYYTAVDPLSLRPNLTGFKTRNGFPDGETVLKYANSGDLGFGRDMHCRKTSAFGGVGEFACYVTNYGNRFSNDEQDYLDTLTNTAPVATVGMEYSRVEDPTDPSGNTLTGNPIVKFYVFKEALGNNRAISADLDGAGERPVPQLCMVCHGGRSPNPLSTEGVPQWNTAASVNLGSKFIPFDQTNLYMLNPNGAGNQNSLRALNCDIVKQTAVGDGVSDLVNVIDSMYGAACAGNQQIGNPVPGWAAGQLPNAPNQQEAYAKVVTPSCRSCHVSQGPATVTWTSAQDFHAYGPTIGSYVCENHTMPHALVTHNRFWLSTGPHQPLLLHDFLNFMEPTPSPSVDKCINP